MVKDVFPARLLAARLRAGMNKAALAEAAGMKSRQVTSRWEEGTRIPDADTLVILARVLGTTVDYLLGTDQEAASAPAQPLDLAEAASGDVPLLWSGRPLTRIDRRRTLIVLRGLLATDIQIGQTSETGEEGSTDDANATRQRGVTVIAQVPASAPRSERPRRRRGDDSGQPTEPPLDGGKR